MKRIWGFVFAMAVLVIVAVGCSGNGGNEGEQEVSDEPVTLGLYIQVGLTDDEFQTYFYEPVKKKFPNVTMQMVRNQEGAEPETLVASNNFPDMVLSSNKVMKGFITLDLLEDLNPYVAKYSEDMGRYEQNVIDSIKIHGGGEKLYALPYAMNFAALFYNKDLFDRFGVNDPKDDMSWDEALQIGKGLTRVSDGVLYRGLDPASVIGMGGQLSLPIVDAATDEVLIDTDGWKQVFNFAKQVYSVPDFVDIENGAFMFPNAFYVDRTLAMRADWGNGAITKFNNAYTEGNPMNWDMVTLPHFAGAEGLSREVDAHVLSVSTTSKHKDLAFQVISHILTDEVQQIIGEHGRLTPLVANETLKREFGKNVPVLEGKNMNAVFGVTPAPSIELSPYLSVADAFVKEAMKRIAVEDIDVNTALREAHEKAIQAVAEQKGK